METGKISEEINLHRRRFFGTGAMSCDRNTVIAFIRRLYLPGVTDPKRPDVQGLAGDVTRLKARDVAVTP